MRHAHVCFAASLVALVVCSSAPGTAQEVVKTGPPPEIRTLIDGVVKALNAGADAWEAFAQQRFSADQLKRQSAAERKQQFEQLHAELGSVTLDGVMCRGCDAPLELNVKGVTGTTRVIGLELDASSPPHITALTIGTGMRAGGPDGDGVPPPPVNGSMTNEELNRVLDGYFTKLSQADVFSGVALVRATACRCS